MTDTILQEVLISCTACKGTKFEVIFSNGMTGRDRIVKLACECGLTFPLTAKNMIAKLKEPRRIEQKTMKSGEE